MSQCVRINQASVSIEPGACFFLQSLADSSAPIKPALPTDLELTSRADGIYLRWNRSGNLNDQRSLDFHLDYLKLVSRMRSFPEPKQGAFNQALGKRTRRVIDATGGWGGDALLMCMQGYEVVIFERHPLMATLLQEAFARLSQSEWMQTSPAIAPQVKLGDAITDLKQQSNLADCVYLDPMFPPKRKKSAIANKQMQLLQWLLGEDLDATQLAKSALSAGYARVAVKRPDYAKPLIEKPDDQFSSKLVHYDVYLKP